MLVFATFQSAAHKFKRGHYTSRFMFVSGILCADFPQVVFAALNHRYLFRFASFRKLNFVNPFLFFLWVHS